MKLKYAVLTVASVLASLTAYGRIIGEPPRPVPESGTGAAIAFLGIAAAIAIGRRMMNRN